ncbi:MAG: Hsp20/alpha crystallin family protein [Desulfobulbus sp.]|nr:Hsp20/alpha crystallin family protein [Desulfobulbus sp.]
MEFKKLAPWNWFKKEEEIEHAVPVKHAAKSGYFPERYYDPTLSIHRDIDRLFDQFFHGFGVPAFGRHREWPGIDSGMLKPKIDLAASDDEYLLTVEIPGVDEKDVSIDITGNTMTVRGEKRQEKEEKEKDYYRIERSYGSFQRVLSLPEDVDQDAIKAGFKNGILSVTMPRKAVQKGEVKQVTINTAE